MPENNIIIRKKKVHAAHAHHGGSWKVAYADFVTAMMAFFMVMWIMGLSDDVRAQISGYFNDPMGFNKTMPQSRHIIQLKGVPAMKTGASREPSTSYFTKDQKALQQMSEKIKAELATSSVGLKLMKQVEIRITREGLRIEFIESPHLAFFASGSSNLLPAAREMLKQIGPLIAESHRPLVIEGHTDAVPYPGESYTNWDLSCDRAQSLRKALSENGVDTHQFQAIRGLADTQLRNAGDPRDASNRRVSILLPWQEEKAVEAEVKPKEKPNLRPETPEVAPKFEEPHH